MGAMRGYGNPEGEERYTVRNRTEIGRKTSLLSRNNPHLWRGSWFTKYLPKYQLTFLQPHEVVRKMISIFLGLRKPRLSGQALALLYTVPYLTALFTLSNCWSDAGPLACPASAAGMPVPAAGTGPDLARGPTWLWSLPCIPWNAIFLPFFQIWFPGLPPCLLCELPHLPPYLPFLSQPEQVSTASKKLDLNENGRVWA